MLPMKTIISTVVSLSLVAVASAFDHTHSTWNDLLGKHVQTQGVDYTSFQKDQSELKGYLKELADVSRKDFNSWNGSDQLSYLINLYNAATVDLVLDHYPIKSFKDEIGGKEGPWKLSFVKALGKTYTLDQIEHELIRKYYAEPRIHFAVNCASDGCPPLRDEAFTGDKLEKQLAEQTQAFLAKKDANRLEGSTLYLSPIFDWFKEDFIKKSGSVEAFVAPYFPQEKIKKGSTTVKYTDYGWDLNHS